jgi:hypothetical protein
MTSMELRLHRGDAPSWLSALGAPLGAPAREFPWESLQAAQLAFEETPDERLGADEIEMLLRWQSSGGNQSSGRNHSSGRNRAAGGDRLLRSTRLRLHTERLERRDVPTPVFAINLLAVGLAPAIAAWNDERCSPSDEPYSRSGVRRSAYVASDRDRRITVSLGGQYVGAQYLGPQCLATQCLATVRLVRLDEYRPAPNDSAIVELLATSVPSSRGLEPLGYCA